MGGMGVLLFFFLSGYGLYKGYKGKQISISFWKKRLINMYFPCVIIQFMFYIVDIVRNQEFNVWQMTIRSLFGAWFIDVILIQYFIFFITWVIAKGKPKLWITLSFLISIVVAFIFWKLKFNARWYNGLMLFPFGMFIAYSEKKIIVLIERKWSLCFILSILLFVISGAFFTIYKEKIAWIDAVKTFSGVFLSMIVCIAFLKIKLCSKIMRYVGKRSLYFYLIHLNLLNSLENINGMSEVSIFYIVLIFMVLLSESSYQLWNRIIRLGKNKIIIFDENSENCRRIT